MKWRIKYQEMLEEVDDVMECVARKYREYRGMARQGLLSPNLCNLLEEVRKYNYIVEDLDTFKKEYEKEHFKCGIAAIAPVRKAPSAKHCPSKADMFRKELEPTFDGQYWAISEGRRRKEPSTSKVLGGHQEYQETPARTERDVFWHLGKPTVERDVFRQGICRAKILDGEIVAPKELHRAQIIILARWT
mmetsp:Transcript_5647/g.12837  ORF Transcript_5647/g.12837 Transcript_5647/m.12837 type:complete len:190 (-) Transcript_5647:471-1040(-)